MDKRLTGNLIEIIATILLGVIILALIPNAIPLPDSLNNQVSPRVFPQICAVIIIIGGLIQLPLYFKGGKKDASPKAGNLDAIKLLAGIIAIFAYVAVLPYLGFVLATILDILVFFYLLGWVRWYKALTTAIVAALILQFVFVHLLNVPLPPGFLGI